MIPADVAYQARYPTAAGREPFPESGAVRITRPSFTLGLTPMPTVTFVEDVAAGADVASALTEVRDLLRERGRSQAAWVISSGDPSLHAALVDAGLTPYTDPPLGPHSTSMALVVPPAGEAVGGVTVREAKSVDDFRASGELAAELFSMTPADAAALIASLVQRHEQVQQGRSTMRTYLAYVDGELVGQAQGADTDIGINLAGSSVHPSARGRGVYRALVAARWEDAVRRGTPALTVQAGEMSRPILERLGFTVVDEMSLLCDRF